MKTDIRNAVVVLAVMTLITGVAYPLLINALAQAVFSHQANGSLILKGDKIVGSELVGQQFVKPEHFWGRISATAPAPYNAASSSGSNLGPANPQLKANAQRRAEELMKYEHSDTAIPIDLLTSSGSGLDPHISPAAAEYQVPRVAKLRQMSQDKVRELVKAATTDRQLWILGEPSVNVLKLNLSLELVGAQRAEVQDSADGVTIGR